MYTPTLCSVVRVCGVRHPRPFTFYFQKNVLQSPIRDGSVVEKDVELDFTPALTDDVPPGRAAGARPRAPAPRRAPACPGEDMSDAS